MKLKDGDNCIELNITQGDFKAAYSDEDDRWCFVQINDNGVDIPDPIVSKKDLLGWIPFFKDFLGEKSTNGTVFMNENKESLLEVINTGDSPGISIKWHREQYDRGNKKPETDIELVRLTHVQAEQLCLMLPKAIEECFNENYGKISYFHYDCKRKIGRGEWCYRASELEKKLKDACVGKQIKHVFVNLQNFIDSSSAPQIFDYDGEILIELDDEVVQIGVLEDGVFYFQEISKTDIDFQPGYGFIPYDLNEDPKEIRYVYDILNEFPDDVRGKSIVTCKVYVSEEDCIGFSVSGFDEKKAIFYGELPASVAIILNNNKRIYIYPGMEYFGISVEDLAG